jgi:acylglycerol lipase
MHRNFFLKPVAIVCSLTMVLSQASLAVEGVAASQEEPAAKASSPVHDKAASGALAAEHTDKTGVVLESTMPPQFQENIAPETKAKYTFHADGDFTKASGLPTYEWMPVGAEPRAIFVAIHGLTLHGRRYRVLARALVMYGAGVVSMDMRGFGRCHFDPKTFSTSEDDRTKVDHEKSYTEIVKLLEAVRKKYPGQRLVVMGESLGSTFAVRLAAEHPTLVDGIVLSAPAVKLNSKMYIGNGNIRQGLKAVVKPSHSVNLDSFLHNLVSPRPDVVNEMVDDPYILKSLTLGALLSTDDFVGKTADWGKTVNKHLPVLIFQGSIDNCVSAKHVTDLMNNMPSDDQTLAWRGSYGHLQLETIFVRTAILDGLANWIRDHSIDMQPKLQAAQQSIRDCGGQIF